jgi:hypothetical protein
MDDDDYEHEFDVEFKLSTKETWIANECSNHKDTRGFTKRHSMKPRRNRSSAGHRVNHGKTWKMVHDDFSLSLRK